MERLHLVELEDLPWMPNALRDGGTDFLDFVFARLRFYRGVVDPLAALLERTGATRLVDLCSGGGGGSLALLGELRARGFEGLELELSDRYPNEAARARVEALADPRVSYLAEPYDALGPWPARPGVRTMCGALHHFRPAQVRSLLQRAVDAGQPLAFFDVAASPALRAVPLPLLPLAAAPNMALLFAATLAVTPLLRPFRWSRLALTYAAPLLPALVAWDGTVSAVRAYAPEELLAITRELEGGERFAWSAGRAGPALYLTGAPVAAA